MYRGLGFIIIGAWWLIVAIGWIRGVASPMGLMFPRRQSNRWTIYRAPNVNLSYRMRLLIQAAPYVLGGLGVGLILAGVAGIALGE